MTVSKNNDENGESWGVDDDDDEDDDAENDNYGDDGDDEDEKKMDVDDNEVTKWLSLRPKWWNLRSPNHTTIINK